MRIQVYEEQYKTKTPHVEPGKIGNDQLATAVSTLGKTLTGAIDAKLEKDDIADMARLEADTRLAAEQMQKEFKQNADPDDYVGDVTRQKEAIQNLIKNQSKKLRLSKNQSEFYSRMTKSVEPAYMGETLQYSWALQHQAGVKKFQEGNDAVMAMLATGSSMMPLADAVDIISRNYFNTTKQYNIDKLTAQKEFDTIEMPKIITTWATAMTDQNPQIVMDTLMGNGLAGYMAEQKALGNEFTIQDFIEKDEIREAYSKSEYAAQFTDYLHYLPYPTRQALFDRAAIQRDKLKKEQEAAAFASSAFTADENERAISTELDYIKEYGAPSKNYGTPHVIDGSVDPALGNTGKVQMGKATVGDIQQGNSVSEVGKTFADGIAGGLIPKGITTKITSDTRPKDKDSKHRDGSATDLVFLKKGQMTMSATIEGYKEAISKYGANIPKKGVLLELRTDHLPETDQKICKNMGIDCLDYIKTQMESQNIDTSWIDWEASKKYRMDPKWSGNHVHFTRNKKADYATFATAGDKASYILKSDLAYRVYQQKRSEGKTPAKAYEAAHEVDIKLLAAWQAETTIKNIVISKDANGNVTDPAAYESKLDALRVQVQKDLNSGKISSDEAYIKMEALKTAKDRLPQYLKTYNEDPIKFAKEAYKTVTSNEQATAILTQQYKIDPVNLRTMTNAEAETTADQLMNKLQGIEAIRKMASIKSESDLRQIANHLTGPKGDILLWAGAASPKMQNDMAAAINTENWKAIELKMKQDKDLFETNWKTKVQDKLNKNAFFKKFIKDYEITQPGHGARLYDAVLHMYAYEKVLGHMGDKSDTDIVNYLVKEMLESSFTSVSVRSPRDGATDLNVSRAIPGVSGREKDIKKVIDVALQMGLDDKQTYVIHGPEGTTEFAKINQSINKQIGADITRQRGSVRRNTTLVSTSNGTGAKFYWKDPTAQQGPSPILRVNDTQPATIPYSKALALDSKIKSELTKYRMSDGSYAAIDKVNGKEFAIYVDYNNMYSRLARKYLSEEFPWLHRGMVQTNFIVPKNKYRRGTDTAIDAMIDNKVLDEKGAEALWNASGKYRR